MKKTLLATAIAGSMAATGAQAATIYNEDGTQVDLYGNIQLAYSAVNNSNGNEADQLADNGSTVGINAAHMITRDMTAYMKLEFEVDAADEIKGADRGLNDGDQAFAGVKGDFGDIRIGSWDPLIDDWAQDKITNNEFADVSDSSTDLAGVAGLIDPESVSSDGELSDRSFDREGDKVGFTSAEMSGFQFGLGFQYKGAAESGEVGVNASDFGRYRSEDGASFFGGAKYTVGDLQLAAIYDDLDNYTLEGMDGQGDIEADAYALSAVYGLGATTLAAKYERTDLEYGNINAAGDSGEIDRYGLSARHAFNFGDVYAGYQYVDADNAAAFNDTGYGVDFNAAGQAESAGDETYNEFLIGANYGISENMYVWAETGVYDREEDADDFVATGVVYSF